MANHTYKYSEPVHDGMNRKLILFSMLFLEVLFTIALTSQSTDATQLYTFKQNTVVDLKETCIDANNSFCDSSTLCLLTILKPDMTTLVQNATMTPGANYFNYTLSPQQTSVNGEYQVTILCSNSYSGFDSFTYLVTPTGDSRGLGLFLVLALGSIILLILSVYIGNAYIGFFAGGGFLSTGVYTMIYGISSLSDLYTRTISYIVIGIGAILWIAAGYDLVTSGGDDDD